jgi:hypothetical protein
MSSILERHSNSTRLIAGERQNDPMGRVAPGADTVGKVKVSVDVGGQPVERAAKGSGK